MPPMEDAKPQAYLPTIESLLSHWPNEISAQHSEVKCYVISIIHKYVYAITIDCPSAWNSLEGSYQTARLS